MKQKLEVGWISKKLCLQRIHLFQSLTKELAEMKTGKGLTELDVLHEENKRAGRNKYGTLRQIRGGNTQRRIDQFENM